MGLTDQQLAAQSLAGIFAAVTSSVPNAGAVATSIFTQGVRLVRVATVAALPAYAASGGVLTASANGALPSIDGVALNANDRVLVTPQGAQAGADTGVYFVSALGAAGAKWALTRTYDWSTASSIVPGTIIETGPSGVACPITTFQVNNAVNAAIIVDTDDPKILAVSGPKLWKARVATVAALAAYTAAGGVLTAAAVGTQAVDGVTIAAGDRVLVAIGAAGKDNGLYVLTQVGAAGAKYVLTRAPEAPTAYVQPQGQTVEVGPEGTALANTSWKALASTAGGPALDTNDPVFYPRTQSGQKALTSGTPSVATVANLFVFSATSAVQLTEVTNQANNTLKGVLTAGLPGTGALAITGAATNTDTIAYTVTNWGG